MKDTQAKLDRAIHGVARKADDQDRALGRLVERYRSDILIADRQILRELPRVAKFHIAEETRTSLKQQEELMLRSINDQLVSTEFKTPEEFASLEDLRVFAEDTNSIVKMISGIHDALEENFKVGRIVTANNTRMTLQAIDRKVSAKQYVVTFTVPASSDDFSHEVQVEIVFENTPKGSFQWGSNPTILTSKAKLLSKTEERTLTSLIKSKQGLELNKLNGVPESDVRMLRRELAAKKGELSLEISELREEESSLSREHSSVSKQIEELESL